MSLVAAEPPVCPLPFSPTRNRHPQDNAGLPADRAATRGCALPLRRCPRVLLQLFLNTFHVSGGWEPRAAWFCLLLPGSRSTM